MTDGEQYEATVALAGAICRAPGTYQTRTSARRPAWIWLKGEKLKGWIGMPAAEAAERFLERMPEGTPLPPLPEHPTSPPVPKAGPGPKPRAGLR